MAKPSKPTSRSRKITVRVQAAVIGIDSNYESVTAAAHKYREKTVYPYLASKGFNVNKLHGPLARRSYAAAAAKQSGVEYITGVGHGSYDTYTGDWYNPIFQIGAYDPQEMNGKIVHFLSCETARDLGPDCVLKGCLAYFGYDEDFTFDPNHADLFFSADSEIDLGFADGQTAAQVYDRVTKAFNDQIVQLKAAGKLYVAALMEYDRDHLRAPASGDLWGKSSAKLA